MVSRYRDGTPLYENGLPFTAGHFEEKGCDTLAFNLNELERRRQGKKPTLIVVDGMSGEGKTTMCVHLLDYLQGREVEFRDHVFMGGQEFIKGLRVCYSKGLVVAHYTEAGDFSKRATLSRLVRTLDRVFETFRTYNIIVLIDLPFMPKLDNGVFEKGIPRMLIHCHGRTASSGQFSVYDADRMLWLRARAADKRVVNKQKIYELVQPNFRGRFKDLHPERSRDLDRFSTRGKNEILEVAEIEGDGLKSYADLAALVKHSHEWVRRKVSSLGIKPVKTFRGRAYFDAAATAAIEASARKGRR